MQFWYGFKLKKAANIVHLVAIQYFSTISPDNSVTFLTWFEAQLVFLAAHHSRLKITYQELLCSTETYTCQIRNSMQIFYLKKKKKRNETFIITPTHPTSF